MWSAARHEDWKSNRGYAVMELSIVLTLQVASERTVYISLLYHLLARSVVSFICQSWH
jgi:hypothetical protein